MDLGSYGIDPRKVIFALDVGTRSVIGVVCYPREDGLQILDCEIDEHPQRDMLDGQIHNIEGVIKTARRIKEQLEKRLGSQLTSVSLAAAGRALKTTKISMHKEISPDQHISAAEIAALEFAGAERARQQIKMELQSDNFYYCIGYSTVEYRLDGYPISNLQWHKGSMIEVDLLATFLPRTVVDSLLTVVEQLGLTVHSLTLEPLAAIEAVVPQEYRHLNLAMVDVGAGTSDIAISNKGSIVAYASVPLAGDEITEKLSDVYLLDFKTAERLKRNLHLPGDTFNFKDIIGNTITASSEELLEVIRPAVNNLAAAIVEVILRYNNVSPRAVFCIGGGSRTPLLRECLAEKLKLPLEKVAVRDFNHLQNIIYDGGELRGPEGITPFGIALSAVANKKYFGFSHVTINGEVVRLLESEGQTVGKCLAAAGFTPRDLIGQRGKTLRVTVNGREKLLQGAPGENARIFVNGRPASLGDPVEDKDVITVEPATRGEDFSATVADVLTAEETSFFLQDSLVQCGLKVLVNGEPASPDRELQSGDDIKVENLGTVADLFEQASLEKEGRKVKVNGVEVDFTYAIQPGDKVELL